MTKARDLSVVPNQSLAFKNKIINGDCRIDQRNNGASVTLSSTGNTYIIDRWKIQTGQTNRLTAQQNAGSVTPPSGFTNYFGCTSSSAYSVVAGDRFNVGQIIEGFNVADLGWGTANAQTVTLSFWVRSSLTGTFSGSLRNSADARSYVFTYSISSANTWEYKTITVAGDTSGTWLTNNGIGLRVDLSLGNGSTFTTSTTGSWLAGEFYASTGSVSLVGTNGATFYITGVQLERGSTATSFDYRPYGTELALCQRYYQVIDTGEQVALLARPDSAGTGVPLGGIALFTTMRTAPTATFSAATGGSLTPANLTTNVATTSYYSFYNNSNVSAGVIVGVRATFGLSSEL